MKANVFLSTLCVSTALSTSIGWTPIWAMDNNNDIFDHTLEKKNPTLELRFVEKIDDPIRFNLSTNSFEVKNNHPIGSPFNPFDKQEREVRNGLPPHLPQKDLIFCPVFLDEALGDLQDRLRKSIVWGENSLKHLKTNLKNALESLQLGDLQKPVQQLIPLLVAPEELVIGSEKGSLGIVLEGFHHSKRKKEIDVLTHPAFGALDDRIKSCEHLAKQLENKGFKETADILDKIKALYENYRQGFLEFHPETMEEVYKEHLALKAELYGALLSSSLIQHPLAYQITSRTFLNKEDKQNKEGTHAVRPLGNMHFKAYDYDNELGLCPGKELAMYHLYRLLMGGGVAPTTLICLAELPFVDLENTGIRGQVNTAIQNGKNILHETPQLEHQLEFHKKKIHFPIQVSSTIEGMGFHTFLQNHFFAEWIKKNSLEIAKDYLFEDHEGNSFRLEFQRRFVTFISPKSINDKMQKQLKEKKWNRFLETFHSDDWSLEHIDEDSFARMTLMSFLTDPGDSKADNFMLTKHNNSHKWHIVSIDTDRVLEPNFKKIESGKKEGHHQVHHKSLFYTLPCFMKTKTLSQTLKDEFKKINAPLKLMHWLLTLRDENKAYEILKQTSHLPEKTYTSMKLPMTFQKGQVLTLLHRIETLQRRVEVHDFNLTLDRTFELMHPLLHAYYEKLQAQYLDPLGMIYADTAQRNNYQELTLEAVLKEEGLKQKDEEGQTFKDLLQNESVSTMAKEQTLEETLEELVHFVNTRAQENQQKQTKIQSSSLSLSMQELILDAGDITLFKRMMNVQGPQAVNPTLARRFYHKVMKHNPNDTELQKAWGLVVTHPHNTKLHWYMGLDHLFLSSQDANTYQKQNPQKQVFKMTSASEGEKYLPQEVWDQLIDKNKQFKKQNQDGAHAVGKATYDGYTLYFKFLPKLPGLEEAVGRWTRNLIGFGAPHVELFKLDTYPVLVSQEIKGLTLKKTIQKHPELLQQLDQKSLAQVLFTTMLVNPEDGKPDNYIVEQISQDPLLYRIVGVDNDQALVPAVAKEQKSGWFKALSVVQVKCILYCLDHMDQPMHQETREVFKDLDPRLLLSSWLNELDLVHQRQVELFTNPNDNNALLKKLFQEHDSYVGVPFKKGDLHEFYDRFLRLQKALHDPNVKTYHDLLMQVEPRLGKRYGVLRHDPNCPKDLYEKFKFVDGKYFSETMGTLTSGKDTLQGKGISEKEVIEDLIKSSRHYAPKLALKELERRVDEIAKMDISTLLQAQGGNVEAFASEEFRNLFFKNTDFNHARLNKGGKVYGPVAVNTQQDLLTGILPYELHDLTLRNCIAFNYPFLRKIQVQNLTHVSLTGSPGVKSQVPTYFSEQCSGLVHLDLSRSPNLVYVAGKTVFSPILFFEKVKNFFVNKCLKLNKINIQGDALNLVEAQKNPSLLELKIRSKTLKALNINKSIGIRDQILDELGVTSPLTILICNKCPQISFPDFREHWPFSIQSALPKETLIEIKKLYKEKLTILNLKKSGISDIGAQTLARNVTLTSLDLEQNNISSIGAQALAQNPSLKTLYLWKNRIDDVGAQALARNDKLTTLYLNFNNIGDVGAQALAHWNTTLTELHLSENNFGDEGAQALAKNMTLKWLSLGENNIGDVGSQALSQNNALTHLTLRKNKITGKGVNGFSRNTILMTLYLGENNVGDVGAQELAKNTSLTFLTLGKNGISNEGAIALADNRTLTHLTLGTNNIGDEGAKAFLHNSTLRKLILGINNIGDIGAQALAQNVTLTSLDLRNNKISDEGAKPFLQNTTLTELNLSDNNVSNETLTLVKNQVEHNKKYKEREQVIFQKIKTAYEQKLTKLDLYAAKVGDEGAEYLSKHPTLTELYLDSNNIGDVGAKHLSKNTTLTYLNLDDNNISDEGVKWLSKNTTLTGLNISPISWEGEILIKKMLERNKKPIGAQKIKDAEEKKLTSLDLSRYEIGDDGAESLSKNMSLTYLNLEHNNIGDVGAEWLSKNMTLTVLVLRNNKIRDAGAKAFLQNTSLRELYLRDNNISEEILSLIDQMLEHNKKRKK